MVVSWQSRLGGQSLVHFGLERGALTRTALGANASSYIDDESFAHHVLLNDLEPSSRFYYLIDGDEEERSFSSAPAEEDANTTSFALFGDLGLVNGDATRSFLSASAADAIDFVWHLGDIG